METREKKHDLRDEIKKEVKRAVKSLAVDIQ
jgi:hypothetical protein